MRLTTVWTSSPWGGRVTGTLIAAGPPAARVLFDPYSPDGVAVDIVLDELREVMASVSGATWRVTAGQQPGTVSGGPVGHILIVGDVPEDDEEDEEATAARVRDVLERASAAVAAGLGASPTLDLIREWEAV